MNAVKEIELEDVAKVAYTAYTTHIAHTVYTDSKCLVSGAGLPIWEALPTGIQKAWKVSCAGVLDYFGSFDEDFTINKDTE